MDPDFEIKCPECGGSLTVTLAEVASEVTKACPLGHSVKVVDKGGGARQAKSSLDELDKTIKRLGGKH